MSNPSVTSFDYTFIDMHCHVLPGVDDGSRGEDESLAMLRRAAQNNISAIIVTPHNKPFHHNVSPEGIDRRIGLLRGLQHSGIEEIPDDDSVTDADADPDAAQDQDAYYSANVDTAPGDSFPTISLYPGNELYYDSTALDRLRSGAVVPLNYSEYVLVEFDPEAPFEYIRDGLYRLRAEGWRPVLAHCERYFCLTGDTSRKLDLVHSLTHSGVKLQVNAGTVPHYKGTRSTLGDLALRGNKIGWFVTRLFDEELVSFIGTDAHRADGDRSPNMLAAAERLSRRLPEDYVYDLLRGNAERLFF